MDIEHLLDLIREIRATARRLDRDHEAHGEESSPVTVDHEGFKAAVMDMHGGGSVLPSDLIYDDAVRILDALAERVEWGEAVDSFEMADSLAEVYTSDLMRWLHHDPQASEYTDEVMQDFEPKDTEHLVRWGRHLCIRSRIETVWAWLKAEAEARELEAEEEDAEE
jgi:hypothetical protein